MSGIVGIVQHNQKAIDAILLAKMTASMAKRGPDAQSFWLDQWAGLGHTLLHTTSEAAHEQQPSTLDGRVWMTADARLDDRQTLIAKLRAHRQTMEHSISDDRLLLSAYEVWGTGCLDHLLGDFAFAIWDAPQQRLFCATDHFGVVPFFYARVADGLLISNTLNCLRLHPDISDSLDEQAVADYLLFRMNYNPSGTIFSDIRRLPAAHSLIYEAGRLQIRQYWKVPNPNVVEGRQEQAVVEQFRILLETAAADRLRTNNVATHLSGGLDSTSITTVAHKQLAAQGASFELQAYTKVFEQLIPHEEVSYAQLVAARLDIPLHRVAAENFSWEMDIHGTPEFIPPEPSFMRRNISRNFIFEAASSFARILLTGFGGDPLLTYRPAAYWQELLRAGQWRSLLLDGWRHYRIHKQIPSFGLSALRSKNGGGSLNGRVPALPQWLDPQFARRNGLQDRLIQVNQRSRKGYYLQQGMIHEPLWQRIFTWHDPAYTNSPLKVRFPFFDVRLLNFVLTIPPLPWLHKKYLLRAAMREMLPKAVVERAKTPLARNAFRVQMMQSGVPDWMKEVAATDELAPYVDRQLLLCTIQAPGDHVDQQYKLLLRPLTLGYWLRGYREHFVKIKNIDHHKMLQRHWQEAGQSIASAPVGIID